MWYTVFDAVQSPPLSSPPCEIGRILVFEKIFNKFFCKKTIPLNFMWTRSSYFCLFFLFKYDEVIIKQPSSCTFGIKVVIFFNFEKFLKTKNHLYLVPLTNLRKFRSFMVGTRQRRTRYHQIGSYRS